MNLEVCTVKYSELKLKNRDAEKIRGYIGNRYIDNNLLHNHDDNKFIYRYPLVQYKVIDNIPTIIGINEAANIVAKIGLFEDELIIRDVSYDINQKEINKENIEFGCTDDYIEYEFVTPWIAINQKNRAEYQYGNEIKKEEILKKILIGNIISMSKGLGYTVSKQLICWINVEEKRVKLKGITHVGFVGKFKVNFKIPDYLGLGKSVSRGFGTIKKSYS